MDANATPHTQSPPPSHAARKWSALTILATTAAFQLTAIAKPRPSPDAFYVAGVVAGVASFSLAILALRNGGRWMWTLAAIGIALHATPWAMGFWQDVMHVCWVWIGSGS